MRQEWPIRSHMLTIPQLELSLFSLGLLRKWCSHPARRQQNTAERRSFDWLASSPAMRKESTMREARLRWPDEHDSTCVRADTAPLAGVPMSL